MMKIERLVSSLLVTFVLPLLTACSMDLSITGIIKDSVAMSSAIRGKANINSWPVTVSFKTAPNAQPLISDFEVENGIILSVVQTSPTSFQVILEPVSDGELKITLPGHFVGTEASLSIIVDTQKPTLTLAKTFASYTHQRIVSLSLAASETIVDFQNSDFQVINGNILSIAGSGDSYTVQVEAQSEGQVSVLIPVNKVTDEAGNHNLASNTLTYFYDVAPPTMGMSLPNGSPTATSPILVDLVSTEPLLDFTSADLVSTNGTVGTLTQIDSTHWQVEVVPTLSGDVTLSLGPNKFTDLAGRLNQGSTSITANYDSGPPSVILSSLPSISSATPIVVAVTFSEFVTGFDASDLNLTNATAIITGAGANYTINLTPLAEGAVQVSVKAGAALDSGSNPSSVSNTVSTIYNLAAPTLAMSTSSGTSVPSGTFVVNLDFSEPINSFSLGSLVVTGGTASNLIRVDSSHYTVEVSPTATAITLSVAANTYSDLLNYPNSTISILNLTVAPDVLLTTSAPTYTKVSPFTVHADFSIDVTGFTSSDLTLTNATATVTGSGKSYDILITPTLSGLVSVSVPSSVAFTSDGAGNNPSNTIQRTYDIVAPVPPTVTNATSAPDTANSPLISWSGSSDGHSGILQYEIALGTAVGASDFLNWSVVAGTSTTLTGLTLVADTNYYASIRVTDNAGNVSTVVSGPAFKYTAPLVCPTGYVRVAALAGFTSSDICVMKYEAKNDGAGKAIPQGTGSPWVSVTRPQAIAACKLNGARYDLFSNDEWQATARQITTVAANWSSGTAYVGRINRGHSDSTPTSPQATSTDDNTPCINTGQTCSATVWDSQRRTHILPNGEVIWDLAGNAHEWVLGDSTNQTSGYAVSLTATSKTRFGPATNCDNITSANDYCGYGKGSLFTAGTAYPITRGGTATYGDNSGLFSTRLDPSENTVSSNFTFRCVYK
ncbi:Ig-like domain-containing protein [Bdellovibrio sp. HCB290]|uniref:Ig-like domain-containing protein n=1 Tax=Bdellovibrio sp. HCB290 TaxID=3394356 RepID=UPI0039B4867C